MVSPRTQTWNDPQPKKVHSALAHGAEPRCHWPTMSRDAGGARCHWLTRSRDGLQDGRRPGRQRAWPAPQGLGRRRAWLSAPGPWRAALRCCSSCMMGRRIGNMQNHARSSVMLKHQKRYSEI
jgi:hypothetical protein